MVANATELARLRTQLSALKQERDRLQEALLRANERFVNTVGSCHNWSFELDARFRFTLSSHACEAILGHPPAVLMGRSLFDLMPEAARAVMEPVLREHAAGQRRLDRIETYLLHREGGAVRVELNGAPFLTPRGRLQGYQGIIRNLSEPQAVRAQLARSEVRYRTLFSALAQGVVFFDAEGRLLAANPAAERFLGHGSAQMAGHPCDALVADLVREDGGALPPEAAPLQRCIASGQPVNQVTVGLRLPGSIDYRWLLVDVVPLREEGELRPFQYLASFTEITAQVRAQHALQERESRLRAIFNAARNVSLIVTDLEGEQARILEFSPGAERIFGYTQEEAVGLPVAMLHLPEEVKRFPAVIAAMARGEGGFGGEATLVRKSGEQFPALFTTEPVFDGFGRMVGTLGVAMDISHLKQTEADLRESRERLADAQRLAQLGWWEWDIRHDRFQLSDELGGLFGEAGEVKRFEHFLARVHPEDRDRLEGRIKRAMKREKEFSLDFRLIGPDGVERHFHSQADVSFGRTGKAIRMAGMAQEITERKRIENRLKETARRLRQQARHLEQVNAELQQFIYVMAHDLKAPLRAVSNLATWLEEDLGAGLADEHRRKLELLRGRVQRMHGLIQALLNYSRAGRHTQVTEVDTGQLVREVAASLSVPAGFVIQIGEGMPQFVTDRLCLAQVLANLVSNAVEHHPRRDGVVRIDADEDRKYHIFLVSDDGKGIAPEYHEKIFEMFQTLEPRDKTERTGIGLALVRKLVTSAGGKVVVESQPGAGTTFRVFWPKRIKASSQFPWRAAAPARAG